MNELEVRRAILKFVNDNKDSWVLNISHSGNERTINGISLTRFTPPVIPYHINISVKRYSVNMSRYNSPMLTRERAQYSVSIELADYIYALPNETNMFEQMVSDFLIVRDRIVNSLYDYASSYGYLESENGYKYALVDGSLAISNVEEFEVNNIPVMFSVIDFSLEGC